MKHSEPSLLIAGAWFVIGLWSAVFIYLFNGLLIWIIADCDTDAVKTLIFWYPAILCDKPEWLDKSE